MDVAKKLPNLLQLIGFVFVVVTVFDCTTSGKFWIWDIYDATPTHSDIWFFVVPSAAHFLAQYKLSKKKKLIFTATGPTVTRHEKKSMQSERKIGEHEFAAGARWNRFPYEFRRTVVFCLSVNLHCRSFRQSVRCTYCVIFFHFSNKALFARIHCNLQNALQLQNRIRRMKNANRTAPSTLTFWHTLRFCANERNLIRLKRHAVN